MNISNQRLFQGTILLALLVLGKGIGYTQSTPIDWNNVESKTIWEVNKKFKNSYIYPRWIDGSPCFFYHLEREGRPNEHILVDVRTGHQEPLLLDTESFLSQYAKATGSETIEGKDFRLYKVSFSKRSSRRYLTINFKGKDFEYDRRNGRLSLVSDESQHTTQKDEDPTEKGQYSMHLRGDSLVCVDQVSNTEWLVNSQYRVKNRRVLRKLWVGDFYIELQEYLSDDIGEMAVIESLGEGRPRVRTFNMPFPGEDNFPRQELFCYNARERKEISIDPHKYTNEVISLAQHHTDEYIYFDRKSRTGDDIDLCRVQIATGKVETLIHEDTSPQFNRTLFNYRFIRGGKELLWWSERTGYGQYYRYSSEGVLLGNTFHDPKRVAGRIIEVDEKRGELLLIAYGGEDTTNPYYPMHYIAQLNGKGERRVARVEAGEEELSLSPDKRYATLKVSRPDLPPIYYAVNLQKKGNNAHQIYAISQKQAEKAGWVQPKWVELLASDGITPLYGLMYLPSNFNKEQKYPIIAYVYPGPQTDMLPTSFTIDDSGNQSLAECGFVVVQVPPRGSSPLRGKDFYTFSQGNMRDYPLEDIKASIEQLGAQFSFIDMDRIGVYGHSGGGFAALTSMLTYPHFYKACLAASGNYDNNIYIQWWGETFHGAEEVKDPKSGSITYSCKIPTTMELANRLAGPLMLITGDQDRNVPPSNTYRMADALMKQGKAFDMLVMPGFDHVLDGPYFYNAIRYFFLKHLRGIDEKHTNILRHK